MTKLQSLIQEIEKRSVCLIAKPGAQVPSCHEYSNCDCEVLKLVKIIEVQSEFINDAALPPYKDSDERSLLLSLNAMAKKALEQAEKIAEGSGK